MMDGNTRRLPPWMIAGVTATSNVSDNKPEAQIPKTKVEKRPRRTVKPKQRDDSEEPKKVGIKRRGRERVSNKIQEEDTKPNIGPEIISESVIGLKDPESVIGLKDEDFTVDDLLSFAQEYINGEEEQTRKDDASLSISESMVVEDNSITRSSQGEPNAEDMLSLLLGPFFKKT